MAVTQSHKQPDLVTKDRAAERLKVSVRTIDRYIAAKMLIAHRITPRTTRIESGSIDRLLEGSPA